MEFGYYVGVGDWFMLTRRLRLTGELTMHRAENVGNADPGDGHDRPGVLLLAMPHVIRAGRADLEAAWRSLPVGPWRWGGVVARLEGAFLGRDEHALLLAAVVVEFGRPIHALVLVTVRQDETAIRLWPPHPDRAHRGRQAGHRPGRGRAVRLRCR